MRLTVDKSLNLTYGGTEQLGEGVNFIQIGSPENPGNELCKSWSVSKLLELTRHMCAQELEIHVSCPASREQVCSYPSSVLL